jgi:hypothetical protein
MASENPWTAIVSSLGTDFKDGYGDAELAKQHTHAVRMEAEWNRLAAAREASRAAAIEESRRSNSRDPYGVGQGSGAALGQPGSNCEEEGGCSVSGGRRRRSRRSRKSKQSKKSRRSKQSRRR